jgi:hypothetical protein
MILRNGTFYGKILRKIFRTGKFSMANFPPHITRDIVSELWPPTGLFYHQSSSSESGKTWRRNANFA